jgi:hypothetical protein
MAGGGGGYHVNRMAKILPSIGVVIVICDVFRTCHNIQGMHNGRRIAPYLWIEEGDASLFKLVRTPLVKSTPHGTRTPCR